MEILWQVCLHLQRLGYPVVVLDGTARESESSPGLLDLLTHEPWNESLPAAGQHSMSSLAVLPSMLGLHNLANQTQQHTHPLQALHPLFRRYALVVVHAPVATLASALLAGTMVSPLLLMSPGKHGVVDSYRQLKHLALHAGLVGTVACVTHPCNCWKTRAPSTPRAWELRYHPLHRRVFPRPLFRAIEVTYTAKGQLDRDAMIRQYLPLVRRLAHHMIAKLPANVELDDLIQVGMIGLSDALTRYEVAQGVQFETFATQRIRGAMLDELRESDWMSRSSRKSQKDIEKAVQRLEQKLGRSPLESEIAAELELALDDYQSLLSKVRGTQLVYLEDMSRPHGHAARSAPAQFTGYGDTVAARARTVHHGHVLRT